MCSVTVFGVRRHTQHGTKQKTEKLKRKQLGIILKIFKYENTTFARRRTKKLSMDVKLERFSGPLRIWNSSAIVNVRSICRDAADHMEFWDVGRTPSVISYPDWLVCRTVQLCNGRTGVCRVTSELVRLAVGVIGVPVPETVHFTNFLPFNVCFATLSISVGDQPALTGYK